MSFQGSQLPVSISTSIGKEPVLTAVGHYEVGSRSGFVGTTDPLTSIIGAQKFIRAPNSPKIGPTFTYFGPQSRYYSDGWTVGAYGIKRLLPEHPQCASNVGLMIND